MVTYFNSSITRSVYLDFEMYFPLIAAKAVEFNDVGLREYEATCEGLTDEEVRCVFIYDDLDKTLRRKQYISASDLSPEEWSDIFGYRVNRAMRLKGVTQEWLANELSISRQTLSRYLNGHRSMSYPLLKQMAELLGCSVDDLANF